MDSPSANPAVLAGASIQWIGLVGENLNRNPWFLPSNIRVSCKFSHHSMIHQKDQRRDCYEDL
jgi:hypothetical protein